METPSATPELPIDLQDKIKKLKALFEEAQLQVLQVKSSKDAVRAAEAFEQKNQSKIGSLKKQFGEYPIVISLCEELAKFFLDVGEMHFSNDKNATTTVDIMYDCASRTVDGVNCSEEIRKLIESTYFSWHWHGH